MKWSMSYLSVVADDCQVAGGARRHGVILADVYPLVGEIYRQERQ